MLKTKKTRNNLNIGIVYAGGISKCAYQLGFTKALLAFVPQQDICVCSGASMGLFSAYALSAGKLAELEDIYESINTVKSVELFWQVCVKQLMSRAMNSFFLLEDELKIPVCFPVASVPLLKTTYYWLCGQFNPFWKPYIKAASSFPLVCGMPKVIDKHLALDGGAVDNIPLYPVLKCQNEFLAPRQRLDLAIVLHFHPRYDYRKEFRTDIPVLDIDVSLHNDFKKRHFDFSREYVREMICSAEEYGKKICKRLFDGSKSRSSLMKKIDAVFLEEHKERQWHESVDGGLTVFNTLGKALRRDSECNKKLY